MPHTDVGELQERVLLLTTGDVVRFRSVTLRTTERSPQKLAGYALLVSATPGSRIADALSKTQWREAHLTSSMVVLSAHEQASPVPGI